MAFGPLQIAFAADVLVPRPWTLEQSRWAASLASSLRGGPLLELCAGVGHIGLVAALESGRPIVQVDAHPGACALARRNAEAAGVAAEVREADISDAVGDDERFVLVIADPPYIATDRVGELPDDPVHAIDGGADGLDLARTCLRVAAAHLVDEGLVLLQLGGEHQVDAVTGEAVALGLAEVERRAYGDDRALVLFRRADSD